MKLKPLMLLTACTLAIGACSKSNSTTDPSPTVPAIVAGRVSGIVFNTLFTRVAGTSIDISDRSGAVVSLVADEQGEFAATGSFTLPITVRASKPGFRSDTRRLDQAYSGQVSTGFDLEFDGPTVSVQPGNYTFTFIADSGCREIPEDLRVRTFAATITPQSNPPINARYVITVSGPSVGTRTVALGAFGNRLAIADGDDSGFGISETLPAFRYFSFGGGAEATVNDSIVGGVSLTAGGDANYCALNTEMPRLKSCYNVPSELVTARVNCSSDRHRIVLEPR